MKKLTAFASDFDHRTLYHTARAAREAEFEAMMLRVRQSLPASCGDEGSWISITHCLRSNIYGAAGTAFIKAAEYLQEYRKVLDGTVNDLEENETPL